MSSVKKYNDEAFIDESYSELDVHTMHDFKSDKKLRKNKKEIQYPSLKFKKGNLEDRRYRTKNLNLGGFIHNKSSQKKYYKDII